MENVRDYGAVGNGIVDDTLAIQQANHAAFNNSTVLFFPPGDYRVTQTINTDGKRNVQGVGPTSRILIDFNGDVFTGNSPGSINSSQSMYKDLAFDIHPTLAAARAAAPPGSYRTCAVRMLDHYQGWTVTKGTSPVAPAGSALLNLRFTSLTMRGLDYGIRFSNTSMLGPGTQFPRSVPAAGFLILDLDIRGNRNGLWWDGGSGNGHTILGCRIIAIQHAVKVGDSRQVDPTQRSHVGDMEFVGCHLYAIDPGYAGIWATDGEPSPVGNSYGKNIVVIGTQFDSTGRSLDWDRIRGSRAIGCSWGGATTRHLTNVDNCVFDTQGGFLVGQRTLAPYQDTLAIDGRPIITATPAGPWALPKGPVSRAAFSTQTFSSVEIAQRLAALITDLKSMGLLV